MLVFDAHLDLSMNALEWNRDLTLPVAEIRRREQGLSDKPDRGNNTVSLVEMRRGQVGLCVATQIARYVKPGNPLPGWNSPQIAWAMTQGQLAWYRAMEELGWMVQITDRQGLLRHLELWQNNPPPDAPIGYILSLEGADSLWSLEHVERAYQYGLRAIGPAHYGPGTYAPGTHATGPMTPAGRKLLAKMEQLGMILDATHLCDEAFWDALDHFGGPVWASHSNCRALVPHDRQFTDEQILALVQRSAVIGMPLDAWMMLPDWVPKKTTPQERNLTLEVMIDHMDHICQLAGNADHVGIGTDLDGGFGNEQCPLDLDTIADLQKLPEMLSRRGYSQKDIEKIMYRNFVDFLLRVWT